MKVEEDHQGFINEKDKIFWIMHATKIKAIEFASYLLKVVVYQWYEGWELSRGVDTSPALWDDFFEAFINHFFP